MPAPQAAEAPEPAAEPEPAPEPEPEPEPEDPRAAAVTPEMIEESARLYQSQQLYQAALDRSLGREVDRSHEIR